MNDGYTGDAFGISASLPLKPLDAGVFSIDGGIQVGIQSDFKCSFIDAALNFVGNDPAALANGACGTHTLSAVEIANDIISKMFVWKGTKMIGVSLSASYAPPEDPDPTLTPEEVAEAAAAAAVEEGIGLSVSAGISSTKLFKQYGGCFGPAPRSDGAPHPDDAQVSALVDMLGFMWMGEDTRLQTADSTPWYERLFTLLTSMSRSATQLPMRIMQTVLAVIQHVTTRQEMPGNCGCMWCRASNLGECIPCTAGEEGTTTDTCRMRHWCTPIRNQGECFANDYTGNFFMERMTNIAIVNAHTCSSSCEAGSSCTYIPTGKCMLSNECTAIVPDSWIHLNDAAAQHTAAENACTAASECSWETAHNRCVLQDMAISTTKEWVGLEAVTHSLFLVDGVTTPVEAVPQQCVLPEAARTTAATTVMVEAVPRECVLSEAERTTPAVTSERDTTECATYHPIPCVGGSPAVTALGHTIVPAVPCRTCVGGRAARYSSGWGRRRRWSGLRPRHMTSAAVPCTTPAAECATYRTETVETTPASVAPCAADGYVMVPHITPAVIAPCTEFLMIDQSGVVLDETDCNNANDDPANPTHKWAHSMMFPTKIVHDNVNGHPSNGLDATSTPEHKRVADTPPIPVLAEAASGASGELTSDQETNNEGAMKNKIDRVLNKIAGLNPGTNPGAAGLLSVIDLALVTTQTKLNEISESGTNMVVHRGVDSGDEVEECYEETHTWPTPFRL